MSSGGGATERTGLCGACLHGRPVRSDRGSTFLLCLRSQTDPRFPRYPRLPVLSCAGYEPESDPGDALGSEPISERSGP